MARLTLWRKRRTLNHEEGTTPRAVGRYARNLAATLAAAIIAGTAARFLWPISHTFAVTFTVGAVTAVIVAPFITPTDPKDPHQ